MYSSVGVDALYLASDQFVATDVIYDDNTMLGLLSLSALDYNIFHFYSDNNGQVIGQ